MGREDPLEEEMAPHSSTLAWKSLGWRSVVGYSPWGRKESDTTEQLHLHYSLMETTASSRLSGTFQSSNVIATPVPAPELPPLTAVPVWVDLAISVSGHPVFLCLWVTVNEHVVTSAEHPRLTPVTV